MYKTWKFFLLFEGSEEGGKGVNQLLAELVYSSQVTGKNVTGKKQGKENSRGNKQLQVWGIMQFLKQEWLAS